MQDELETFTTTSEFKTIADHGVTSEIEAAQALHHRVVEELQTQQQLDVAEAHRTSTAVVGQDLVVGQKKVREKSTEFDKSRRGTPRKMTSKGQLWSRFVWEIFEPRHCSKCHQKRGLHER